MQLRRVLCLSLLCLACLSGLTAPSRAADILIIWNSLQPPLSNTIESWIETYPPLVDGSLGLDLRVVPHFALGTLLDNPPDGQLPDLILAWSDAAAIFAERRSLAVLDADIPNELRTRFSPLAWDLAIYDRTIAAIPVALEGLVLFYNRTLETQPVPTTFDNLLGRSAQLTQGEQIGLSMSADFYSTAGLYLAEGGNLLNPRGDSLLEASLNPLTRYLTRMRDLSERSKRGELSLSGSDAAFLQGKTAYLIAPSSYLTKYQAALGDQLGVAKLPALANSDWRPLVRGYQFYVMPRTTKRAVAIDFAGFATQATGSELIQFGLVSARADATALDALLPSVLANALQNGVPQPNRPEMAAIWRVMRQAIADVTLGGVDPARAARMAADAAKTEIAAIRTR